MSTEISVPITVVSPRTGEILTLDASTDDLGQYLADVREHESVLKEAKAVVTNELLARMDKGACWTVHAAGLKLASSSPQPVEEWDGAELREQLLALVDEGVLAVEAVDAAVEVVVTYKPRKAGINALRKVGGRVAEVVDSLCQVSEKRRYITVSRA